MRSGSRQQRSGLLLIACALVVIAVTSGFVLEWQLEARRDRSRAQGASLARLLSSLPYERILPEDERHGALRVVRSSQSNPDFAYAVVVGEGGEPLAQEVSAGVVVPEAPLPGAPSSWVGERLLEHSGGGTLREFHAPLLRESERVGEIRIGFREPGLALLLESSSLFGALALPIFLMAPLAYALLRSELRPMAAAAGRLESLIADSLPRVELEASSEVSSFLDRFDRFVGLVEQRVGELEGETSQIRATSRVLGYQKSRAEAVLESLPDATVVLDERGVTGFASSRLAPVLGVDPQSALGRPVSEWCSQPEVLELLAPYLGPRPRQRSSDAVEFAVGEPPERRIAASLHPLPAPGPDADALSGSVLLFRDVTAESQARQAQREFVSHVAHELKNPLHVIGLYSEALVGEEGASPEYRIEASNVLRDEVERVSSLVSTLLTISRLQAGSVALHRQRVRLQDLLADVLDSVSRAGKRANLDFKLDLPPDLPSIQVDKELLRVALNNLVTNAIKYNRDGGQVVLSAREDEKELAISVRDTGLGIAEQDLEAIFEKFFRSDDPEVQKRGGHGLGLALVREIAALHRAEVQVQSQPQEGSTFSIVFRRSQVLCPEDSAA